MKKRILVLICLSLVLLSGCQLRILDKINDLGKLQTIVPPAGREEDYNAWNIFVWDCNQEKASSVVLLRTHENGSTDKVTVSYDGEKYAITDNDGTRTYSYLVSASHTESSAEGYTYGDYFFLTDDYNMTFEKYQKAQSSSLNDYMQLLLPTELVLGKVSTTAAVKPYGSAPAQIQRIFSRLCNGFTAFYEEDSFFTSHTVISAESERTTYRLNRYDYNGEQLCSVDIPLPVVTTVSELTNGGFCTAVKKYDDINENSLLRYNDAGKLLWRYDFQINRDVYLRYIFQKDNTLYCFGLLSADASTTADDLYFAAFSLDGVLLTERIAGGSNFEQFDHVVVSDEGFTVYGKTQSRNGDFPFSEDGSPAGFTVHVNHELLLSGIQAYPESQYISRHYGYYKETAIYDGNVILAPQDADRLPQDVDVAAIFAFGDGYVILRRYTLEPYAFSSPEMSYQPYYHQLIATYYDASGAPVWQTVSAPFVE